MKRYLPTVCLLVVMGAFLLVGTSFAQELQDEILVSFVNSASRVTDANFVIAFPEGIIPIELTSEMTWNSINKTLIISLVEIAPNQEVGVPVIVQGAMGDHQLVGKLTGRYADAGHDFESDPIIFNVDIRGQRRFTTTTRTQTITKVAQNVAVPVVIVAEVVGAAALAAAAGSSNASIAFNFVQLLRFLTFGHISLRRKKPWGIVYDSLSRKPIRGAKVSVFESTYQKLKGKQYSDKEGRFGFVIAPGSYYVTVERPGYQTDRSQTITISEIQTDSLNINVFLLPFADISGVKKGFAKFWRATLKIVDKLSWLFLGLGTVLSAAIVIVLPTTFNIILLSVYILIDFAKMILSRVSFKSGGQVNDRNTGQPLELAVVRIFNADRSWLLNSTVTGVSGYFKFLITPGNYYITCTKAGYKPFSSEIRTVKKSGLITWDLRLEPVVAPEPSIIVPESKLTN